MPVTSTNINFAPFGLIMVILGALAAWYLPVHGARHWYRGPRHALEDLRVQHSAAPPPSRTQSRHEARQRRGPSAHASAGPSPADMHHILRSLG